MKQTEIKTEIIGIVRKTLAPFAGKQFLEVGLSGLSVTLDLAKLEPDGMFLGVDQRKSTISEADILASEQSAYNTTFEQIDFSNFNYDANFFDAIFSVIFSPIQLTAPEQIKFYEQIVRSLKKTGTFFILIPQNEKSNFLDLFKKINLNVKSSVDMETEEPATYTFMQMTK